MTEAEKYLISCAFCAQPVADTNPGYLYYGSDRRVWHEACLYKQLEAQNA